MRAVLGLGLNSYDYFIVSPPKLLLKLWGHLLVLVDLLLVRILSNDVFARILNAEATLLSIVVKQSFFEVLSFENLSGLILLRRKKKCAKKMCEE